MNEAESVSKGKYQNNLDNICRLAIENALEAIAIFDQDGRFIIANHKTAHLLNTNKDALIGKTLGEVLMQPDAGQFEKAIHRAVSSGETAEAEASIEIRGETLWFRIKLQPIIDQNSPSQYIFAYLSEITDYKQAIEKYNQSHTNLEILLKNTEDLILIADLNYKIILVNEALEERIKFDHDVELKPGMSLEVLSTGEENLMQWRASFERALQGETFKEEMVMKYPNRKTRYFEAMYQPIYQDDQVVGCCQITREITERKTTELALTESEARFRQLAENIKEVFWIGAPDWSKIHYISPAYEEVWGLSCTSLYQNPSSWGDAIIPEDREKVQAEIQIKASGDLSNPHFPEYRVERPDGTIRWISARAYPIRDHEGNILRIVGIAEDITDRKLIEIAIRKSENRYRNLFNTMLNGFAVYEIIYDSESSPVDFKHLEVNTAFEKMTGLKSEEIVGKTVLEVNPNIEDHWLKSFIQVAATGEPARTQYYSDFFGKYFNYYTFQPEEGRIANIFTDVTKEVLADQELQRLNEELEQRVAERTKQLEQINKDLKSFSYSVSHDLRAPLRAITGFSQILMDEYCQSFDEEAQMLLERTIIASKKMDSLIDGLLTLSRISQTGLEIETVHLSALARQVYGSILTTTSPNHKINLTVHDTPPVQGDPRLLEAAINNLISNAIKYTSSKELAEIEFGHLRQNDQDIFYLKDNGVGFNMEHADKLFTLFQRHDPSGEFEGTGIGLTIVQQVIERHNGKVWAKSKPGEGSTFYFHL